MMATAQRWYVRTMALSRMTVHPRNDISDLAGMSEVGGLRAERIWSAAFKRAWVFLGTARPSMQPWLNPDATSRKAAS